MKLASQWHSSLVYSSVIILFYIFKSNEMQLGVSLFVLLLHIIFSYMFQLVWVIARENQVQEDTRVKTLIYILTIMCS
jgi:hypothetical protein